MASGRTCIPAIRILLVATFIPFLPTLGWAQRDGWLAETSATIGLGHVFRFDDEAFGNPLNAGGAVAVVHRSRWAIEFKADRVFGLEPRPAPCALVNNSCIGDGRYGPREAVVASVGVQSRFGGRRIQPFVTAGVGVLWTTSLHIITYSGTNPPVTVQSESSGHGLGPDLGAGLRILLSPRLAIGPEMRWLGAPLLSRENPGGHHLAGATKLLLRLRREFHYHRFCPTKKGILSHGAHVGCTTTSSSKCALEQVSGRSA